MTDTTAGVTSAELDAYIEAHFVPETREETLAELKETLQTAVWIELATIPIYLSVYYSILRKEHSGQNMTPADVFADKAGGIVMSVAVEEMLHMSLSSNILYSLGVDPQLYGHSPSPYPTGLPYHNPVGPPGPAGPTDTAVAIPLAKFSYDQLWHLLQIEYPDPVGGLPQDRNWNTIGQFYAYIRALINSDFITDDDFRVRGGSADKFQIQPYNYSPSNVDTIHPTGPFDPWSTPSEPDSAGSVAEYANRADSHAGATELLTVNCKQDALHGITTICNQGEGANHGDFDDNSDQELSHYEKFLTLQAQLERYPDHIEVLAKIPKPPAPIVPTVTDAELATVIANFPDSPTTASYANYYNTHPGSVNYAPLSDLINGIYQYMLILVETIFKVEDTGPDAGGQKLFFNQALHRSMIWVLDKLIQGMRTHDLGNGQALAPTFENIDLGPRDQAFANLLGLTDACKDQPYWSDVSYYVDTIKTLPDVSQYWGAPAQPGEPVPSPYPYAGAPSWPTTPGTQPSGLPLHACMGLNSCKASDRFGVEGPADGPNPGVANDCAGQGYCSTTSMHTCHVQNACRNQGGCGLYGTADELNHPAVNECKSLGSCATPINAERFSMNGPNQGKSVWARAREVFAERWANDVDRTRSSISDTPATLGPAPAPFADSGPPYLWVSDNNTERSNMTACGASGMSGAGGCS